MLGRLNVKTWKECLAGLVLAGCGDSTVELKSQQVSVATCAGGTGSLVVENHRSDAVPFVARIAGGAFTVAPDHGSLAPNASTALTLSLVMPPPTPNVVLTGELTLETVDGEHKVYKVPVRADGNGGQLSYAERELDFGDIPVGASASLPLHVRNTGGSNVDVMFPTIQDFTFGFSIGAHATVAPGDEAIATVAFKPTSAGSRVETFAATSKDPLCPGWTPKLHGRGVDGVVGVTPGSVDFGLVDCGTGGGMVRLVSILNTSKNPINYAASLSKGQDSIFALGTPSGVVPAQSKSDLVVVLKGMPQASSVAPDVNGDTITVTTDAPNDTPHAVAIHATAQGAILTWSAPMVDAGHIFPKGSPKPGESTLTNNGNKSVTVTASASSPFRIHERDSNMQTVSIPPAPMPGLVFRVDATRASQPLGVTLSGTASLTTSDALCAPLPSLSASGVTWADATKIAVGGTVNYGHVCVSNPEELFCWGNNSFGELGDGTTIDRVHPTPIPVANVASIAVDTSSTCVAATMSPNDVYGVVNYCWGNVFPGGVIVKLPAYIATAAGFRVAYSSQNSSANHGCIGNTGLSCWGSNQSGQLGDGTVKDVYSPKTIPNMGSAFAVGYAGYGSTCSVLQSGKVACVGSNWSGELGQSASYALTSPVIVPNITDAVDVSGYNNKYCARRSNGHVSCWGGGDPTVYEVGNLTDATFVVASDDAFCAITQSNNVKCWGANGSNAFYNQSANFKTDAAVALPIANVASLAASYGRFGAILVGGGVRMWGMFLNGLQTVPGLD